VPGLLDAVIASQSTNSLRQCGAGARLRPASSPSRWPSHPALEAPDGLHAGADGEHPVGKLIATSAKQIGMFLVILAVVSAAIVAFIIYTLTMDKIREIAVLKLIGTRNRTIACHDPAAGAGAGRDRLRGRQDHATFAAPIFPKYVLLMPADSSRALPPCWRSACWPAWWPSAWRSRSIRPKRSED
jgi:putative ABC transport system permease protein